MKQLQKKFFVFLLTAIILLGSTLTVYAEDTVVTFEDWGLTFGVSASPVYQNNDKGWILESKSNGAEAGANAVMQDGTTNYACFRIGDDAEYNEVDDLRIKTISGGAVNFKEIVISSLSTGSFDMIGFRDNEQVTVPIPVYYTSDTDNVAFGASTVNTGFMNVDEVRLLGTGGNKIDIYLEGFTYDPVLTIPALSSATLDISTGTLVLSGTDFEFVPGVTNDIDATKITISDGAGGHTRTLTSETSNVEITNGTTAALTVSGADLAAIASWATQNGTQLGANDYNIEVAAGWNGGNSFTETTQPLTVSGNVIYMSVNDVTINEDAGNATFTISLSQAYSSVITVDYATASNTALAPYDYTTTSGTATIIAGNTSATVTVPIENDTIDEENESFYLSLSNNNVGVLTDSLGECTITDNDNEPTIRISDATVTEGDSGTANLIYTLELSSASGKTITVIYATADGTATVADNDYISQSSTLTFAPGEKSKTITITVNADTTLEEDETVLVNLANPDNVNISDSQGSGTITNDDTATDTTGPTIVSDLCELAEDNSYIDIVFSEEVYGAANGSTPLVSSQLGLRFWQNVGGTAGSVSLFGPVTKTDGTALTGGETIVRLSLGFTGTPNGLEEIEITLGHLAHIYDLAGNEMLNTATTGIKALNDLVPPTPPAAVTVLPVGGTVIENALNRSSTNMTATATIIAGDATGGRAELFLNATKLATDNAILSGDTQVTFDIGQDSSAGLRLAIPSGGTISVKLYDAAGNSSISSVGNPYLTVDYENPSLENVIPLDNATNIDVNTDLVITFNENIAIGTGNIVIKKTSDDSIIETIAVTSGQVTGNGTSTITINSSVTLDSNTEYYVLIDATAFYDISGNSFIGVASTTVWSFKTANSAKAITAFNFNGLIPNVTGTVDEASKTIALTVPYGTDVTELVPTITHTGASVSPNTGVAQNFTSPVEYTITAADSSTQIYTVTVTVADPLDITAASVTITAPALGAVPQVTAAVEESTANPDYTVTNLVWNEPFTAGGKFKAGQIYTATVTLTSKNNSKFQAAAFTPTVAGSSSVGTTTTSGGDVLGNTVSFTVTYPVTGALQASSIEVTTQPTKMSYTESTDSTLALNGMQVTETNNDGSNNVVTFTDGTALGYTTNPVNGSTLTNATHNGTPVVITHTASGMTSNTNPLTVNTAPSGGGGGSGNSTPVPPAPVITVSEVKSKLFENTEDIKVEADVTSAFGQSVEVKITDSTESQNEVFSLAGADDKVYPFDISLYSRESNQKVQPKDGYSVKITIPVPEKLLEDREQIKVVYGKDGKLETLKSELIEKDGKWYIVFEAVHFSPYALVVSAEPSVPWTNPFSDVQEGSWYYSAIQYVAQNGLMLGTGSNTFSPQLTTNRGMIATILYRLNGSDETFQSTFKDVNFDAYYAKAVAWAQEKGIIAGYGNGMFGPEDNITREQMATILWRYAGSPVAADSKGLAGFKDAGEISAYAKDALAWIYETGIIAGKGNGILDPKGHATRAEVATIIINYVNTTEK